MPYKDPEKKKLRDAARRKANPEKHRTLNAAWRKANPEKDRASSAAWARAHPDEKKASNAARRKAHPEMGRTANARRKAKKKDLPATLTIEQWEAIKLAYGNRCAYCGKKETIKRPLTQDHVIPISKGGGTTPDNIVPACKSCNSSKHTNLPRQPVKLVLL